MSGNGELGLFNDVIFIDGTLLEEHEDVYKCYCLLDDGGIVLTTIPAHSTTIYPIESNDEPHLDTINTAYFSMDYSTNPPRKRTSDVSTKYELYIPKESIKYYYEFTPAN